jgi:hypothetical protein
LHDAIISGGKTSATFWTPVLQNIIAVLDPRSSCLGDERRF